jgi:hypothetical protein
MLNAGYPVTDIQSYFSLGQLCLLQQNMVQLFLQSTALRFTLALVGATSDKSFTREILFIMIRLQNLQ